MNTITVKKQSELDLLPEKFDEFTSIEINSPENIRIYVTKAHDSSQVTAYGSSQVTAYGSSRVTAHDSSQVSAHDSSQVTAWDNATVYIFDKSFLSAFFFSVVFVKSVNAKINHLADKSTAKFCGDYNQKEIIMKKDKTAHVELMQKELSFETYLERGYVKADGIIQKLISRKRLETIEVFEVENHFSEKSFVVKKGEIFSHGKTIKEAKESLKFKISTRDTSEYKKWGLKTTVSQAKMIQAYRAITGACEFGVRDFFKGKKIPLKLRVSKAIEITAGNYGNKEFENFFK